MTKVSKLNFPSEEQADFNRACRELGFDSSLFNYGAVEDGAAMGAGLIAREIEVYYDGQVRKYADPGWVNQFREDLAFGKWSRQ